MTDTPNPLAPHHLPWFITAPGGTDYLFIGMTVLIIVAVLGIGNLYFQLHSLPERRAHHANVFQMEIVAVLCLARPLHASAHLLDRRPAAGIDRVSRLLDAHQLDRSIAREARTTRAPFGAGTRGKRRTGRAGRAAPDSGRANDRAAARGRASAGGGKDVSHA